MSADLDLDALREKAEKATPGPWAYCEQARRPGLALVITAGAMNPTAWPRDAAFIAAANPATVLALLDRVKTTEQERDEARSEAVELREEATGAVLDAVDILGGSHRWQDRAERAEARLAKVQALLTTPGFDDHDLLREALGGEQRG